MTREPDIETPPPPRWAEWAAYIAVLTTLPSGLWRIGLALGLPLGYSEDALRQDDTPGWGSLPLVGLSVLTTAAAMLTLGLVQQWGETVPRWIPGIGGRRVPPRAALIPAAIGAVLLTTLWTQLLWWWSIDREHDMSDPAWQTMVGFFYLPMVAWGPLLGAVTISYYYRRRRPACTLQCDSMNLPTRSMHQPLLHCAHPCHRRSVRERDPDSGSI